MAIFSEDVVFVDKFGFIYSRFRSDVKVLDDEVGFTIVSLLLTFAIAILQSLNKLVYGNLIWKQNHAKKCDDSVLIFVGVWF